MTPAIIKIGYKYQLDSTDSESVFSTLYKSCLSEFTSQMEFIQSFGYPKATDYKLLRPEYQQQVMGALNVYIKNLSNFPDLVIPKLTDESEQVKFISKGLKFNIVEGNTESKTLIINLYFTSDIFTLVGTISDKIIIVEGDKTTELMNKNELKELLFIKHTSDMWFKSFQKI